MIIVSQDKKAIHNFDNVLSLQIVPTLKEYSIEVCDAINDGSSLGIYSSEERAKEVLQEIIKRYSSYLKLEGGPAILRGQIDIQPNIFNIPKVFEMPKE
ncbi:MAG: hypothetical protein KHW50_07435 [Clostridium sp.]|jgi:hypothetical protein|nr:hypothetical protein [Clostridium sp.]